MPAVDPPIAPLPPAEPPVDTEPIFPRRNEVALPVGQEDEDDHEDFNPPPPIPPRMLSFRLPLSPLSLATGVISSTILITPAAGARLADALVRACSPPRNVQPRPPNRVLRITAGRDKPGFYKETRPYERKQPTPQVIIPLPFPDGKEEILSGGGEEGDIENLDDSLSVLFGNLNVDERDEATSTSTGPMDCD